MAKKEPVEGYADTSKERLALTGIKATIGTLRPVQEAAPGLDLRPGFPGKAAERQLRMNPGRVSEPVPVFSTTQHRPALLLAMSKIRS